MSGLSNMKARIGYRGGEKQQDRMVADKLHSLRNALVNSYQAATVVVRNRKDEEGKVIPREFRALINPNKLTMDLDDKVISIPFEDICLNAPRVGTTTEGMVSTDVKIGDIIEWKQPRQSTFWIIYDQYLQELAYFRGQMRQCEQTPLDIDGVPHYYYLKGPDEKGISWQKSKHFFVNNLNYSVEMYISKTQEAKQLFQRFAKINLPIKNLDGTIDARPFEVQAVDDISSDGVMVIYLKEDFSNKYAAQEDITPPEETIPGVNETPSARITGPSEVYPYDTVVYTATQAGGSWAVDSEKAVIITDKSSDTQVTIDITTGRSGKFNLIYNLGGVETIQPITILPL